MTRKYGRNHRDHLSPRGVAKLCQVNFKTVLRWIHCEDLKAYQLPGGSNRVSPTDLLEFLYKYKMPWPENEKHINSSVLLITEKEEICGRVEEAVDKEEFKFYSTSDKFDAGFYLVTEKPNIVILDMGSIGMRLDKTIEVIDEYFQDAPTYMSNSLICVREGFKNTDLEWLGEKGVEYCLSYEDVPQDLPEILKGIKDE